MTEQSIEEEARAAAEKLYPPDHEVDDPFGETGVARSDPYGYDETARNGYAAGYIAGASREPAPADKCGRPAKGGPCVLPRGHNMGHLDVPSNHRAAPADEREALVHIISQAVGGWNPDTRAITNVADAILASEVWRNRHPQPIPPYAMLDVWMALYGTSHPEFDTFYEKHGYAETWARLMHVIRHPQVTDEMIEAAARAWAATSPSSTGGFESMSSHRQWLLMMRMRAVLEAALGEKHERHAAEL